MEINRLDDARKVAIRLRQSHPDLALGANLLDYIRNSMATMN